MWWSSASTFSGCHGIDAADVVNAQVRRGSAPFGVAPVVVSAAGSALDVLTSRHPSSSLVIRTAAGSELDGADEDAGVRLGPASLMSAGDVRGLLIRSCAPLLYSSRSVLQGSEVLAEDCTGRAGRVAVSLSGDLVLLGGHRATAALLRGSVWSSSAANRMVSWALRRATRQSTYMVRRSCSLLSRTVRRQRKCTAALSSAGCSPSHTAKS